MYIEPDVFYALFRAVDEGTDFQTHILIDLRIANDLDTLIVEVEGVRLARTSSLLISQYRAVLQEGLGAALEDMGLQLALEEYEDEDEGSLYTGVDLLSEEPLVRAVERDHDILILQGSQLIDILGENPDFLGDDKNSPRVEITIIPDNDGDFWIRPTFSLQTGSHYLEIEGVACRLPWSHIRRKLLQYGA